MNIEELSKSQLLLLTILVNFVTAVATGILTVSLLDRAPPVVTQTVDRIIENTVQTVAAAAPAAVVKSIPAPSTEDLITAAFAADSARLVSIYEVNTSTSTPAAAIGTYLPKARAVATATTNPLPHEALIVFADGSSAPASLSRDGGGIAIYGFADKTTLPSAPSPALVAAKDLKLGETTLALTADGGVATGIVSRVAENIHTTLPATLVGAAAVDINGNLIGIADGSAAGAFISADRVFALLTATSSEATSTASH